MDVEAKRRDQKCEHPAGQRDEEEEATAAQLSRRTLEFIERVLLALAVMIVRNGCYGARFGCGVWIFQMLADWLDGFSVCDFRGGLIVLFKSDMCVDCR